MDNVYFDEKEQAFYKRVNGVWKRYTEDKSWNPVNAVTLLQKVVTQFKTIRKLSGKLRPEETPADNL